ncbi:hypothetical protein IU500_18615 [Nocardia terpenica]|uniref:hypothetical protein n=1 Tax=Nocardia terpenica TaxID=455432 RepID=UPI001896302E|nr:hypothetical protein [Nocardia terpenica]MBF6063500.1 hypothetical protein [Nocardia terpenica]MBF6106056.1 hypothetical protein [Nocardia terpenica]MBF6113359.1 hypothetical protein [Nocardia terpenica]MBF6119797.1 hypothetical protein [Nocardia terpenica]MBF6152208.1 hypothetical protein [Nocardia terpenica]
MSPADHALARVTSRGLGFAQQLMQWVLHLGAGSSGCRGLGEVLVETVGLSPIPAPRSPRHLVEALVADGREFTFDAPASGTATP